MNIGCSEKASTAFCIVVPEALRRFALWRLVETWLCRLLVSQAWFGLRRKQNFAIERRIEVQLWMIFVMHLFGITCVVFAAGRVLRHSAGLGKC